MNCGSLQLNAVSVQLALIDLIHRSLKLIKGHPISKKLSSTEKEELLDILQRNKFGSVIIVRSIICHAWL